MIQRIKLLFYVCIIACLNIYNIEAYAQNISVTQAYDALNNDELAIIDIRTPHEWSQSGVINSAYLATMHQPLQQFLTQFDAIVRENPHKKIALICARGVRSARLQHILQKQNIAVLNIEEGYLGYGRHKGWIARNLPITTYKESHK